jgi:hypothetical protein
VKASSWMLLSIVVLAAGVSLLIAALVLPHVKLPQTFSAFGPATPYGNSTYMISGYAFPEIDKGQEISIGVSEYLPGTVSISFFPAVPGSVSPSGPPILFRTDLPSPDYAITFLSPATEPYGLYVSSVNRTSFLVTVKSVWSPFDPIRGYVPEGLLLMLAGIVGWVHFRGESRREKEYERVLRGAGTGKPQGSDGATLLTQRGNG